MTKINTVLVCAGLIGLAMSFALFASGEILDSSSVVKDALTPFLFSLVCFSFIGIGRFVPVVIQKRHQRRQARHDFLDRYKRSGSEKIAAD